MVIPVVVPYGKDIVDILDGWEGRGRYGEGEDGEEVGELHFGLYWVKRVALEKSNWWCCFWWLGFALLFFAWLGCWGRLRVLSVEGDGNLYRLSVSLGNAVFRRSCTKLYPLTKIRFNLSRQPSATYSYSLGSVTMVARVPCLSCRRSRFVISFSFAAGRCRETMNLRPGKLQQCS